jgi:hypothetical protein
MVRLLAKKWAEATRWLWRKIVSRFGIILKFREQHQSCIKKDGLPHGHIYCCYKMSLNFTVCPSKTLASCEEKSTPGNNGSKERVMSLV